MQEIDLTWAACAIDCEGSIGCSKRLRYGGRTGHTWAISVRVTNTDPRLLHKLQQLFGIGIVKPKKGKAKHQPLFEWQLYSRKAVVVLEAVRPYLVIKGEQADLALAIAATMSRKGKVAWTGSNRNRSRQLDPAIVTRRNELSAQLKYLKRNPPLEVVS